MSAFDFFGGGASLGGALKDFMGGLSLKTVGLAGLQGATSIAGLMQQMAQSERNTAADVNASLWQALDAENNARQAEVAGQGEIVGLRQKLADTLGQRMAAAAGSGVDVGQGVVADNARQITGRSLSAEEITRQNTRIAVTRHNIDRLAALMRASQAQENGRATRRAALGSGLLGGLMSIGRLFL